MGAGAEFGFWDGLARVSLKVRTAYEIACGWRKAASFRLDCGSREAEENSYLHPGSREEEAGGGQPRLQSEN